jgi:hypothetical protein
MDVMTQGEAIFVALITTLVVAATWLRDQV